MRGMRCAAIGLLVLGAGCAPVQSDAPTPPAAAVAVEAPVKPAPPATTARAAAKPANPKLAAAKPANPKLAAGKPAATLDVAALTSSLRNTGAIGVFTKLALKNQMDDLLQQLRAGHQSGGVAGLRQPFDLLVLKVLAVVQDGDPALARTVSGSREALWSILADPVKFNALA